MSLSSSGVPQSEYEVLVVGGGHNGLVAAAYLSRLGVKTAVLERRPVLGGAAVTEEIVPGYKFSRSDCSPLIGPDTARYSPLIGPDTARYSPLIS